MNADSLAFNEGRNSNVIRGYAEQPSPRPGETVVFRVSTDAPQFRIEFYRCGQEMAECGRTGWLRGVDAPLHLPFHDFGRAGTGFRGETLDAWPSYPFPIPPDWRSGVFIAVFIEGDGGGRDLTDPDRTTPDGREGRALFVVRAPAETAAPILFKVPLLTYAAYNLIDGERYDKVAERGQWCLYNMPRESEVAVPIPRGVGLHRPGGGTGATPYDTHNFDPFDATPRQTFIHWDGPFVAWLEREGYAADFCTDVDLHRDGGALLAPYRLLVSVGHDEYWSEAMRTGLDAFISGGGNAAFFSGNTAWWRVVFEDDVTFYRAEFWHEAGWPENASIGVSFRNGGERDCDEHPIPVGFRVQHADHWVYAGTGLRDGDVFGDGPNEYIVGYECDGAEFDRAAFDAGALAAPTGADATPGAFTILGIGDTRPSGWGIGNSAATMGVFTRGGTLFNAATTDWPRVATAGASPIVERITRNVIDRLSAG